jgi:L-amino acid N-acyltransferase YncA
MNLLIDTNIFIPLEPTSIAEVEKASSSVAGLLQLAQTVNAKIFIHPAILDDISRDTQTERRTLHLRAASKYCPLPSPPGIDRLPKSVIRPELKGTNSWVDNCLIAAVYGNACDFLVTEDQQIHSKARKLDLSSRVLYLQDAIDLLSASSGHSQRVASPNVDLCHFHEIDHTQPFFDSLRSDYRGFDKWFAEKSRKHRQAFVIWDKAEERLAAIAAIKEEASLPDGNPGKVLKLCTLKVSDQHMGMRYGELLLSSVCDYCHKGLYTHTYFTAFPKHEALLGFADTFGFEKTGRPNSLGEYAFVKRLAFGVDDEEGLTPMEFYRLFGPQAVTFSRNQSYLVPIQPQFLHRLWPELEPDGQLFPPEPCGNSIRKAYLCHSLIKRLRPGDNLFFYRSQTDPAVVTIGSVESVNRTKIATSVMRKVGSRTVYSMDQVAEICKKPALVILFRHAKTIPNPISLAELKKNGAASAAPQTIIQLEKGSLPWLKERIKM